MNDQDRQLQLYYAIDQLRNKAFYECFPGVPLNGWGQSGPEFHAYLHKENRHFTSSNYYYHGYLEFFHLTSIPNLFSILSNRAFRLYNLHHSTDEEEYNFAGKLLGLSSQQIHWAKQYFFTLSFCPISDLLNRHVWEVYGGNFSRVAITFSIEDDPVAWDNFQMAQVQYAAVAPFEAYWKKKKEIEVQFGVSLTCDLSQLIGFHKTAKWAEEKEVRLATYLPYNDLEAYWKHAKVDYRMEPGRNRMTNYIELPLWVDNDSSWINSPGKPQLDRTQPFKKDYFATRPRIKLKKIFIGEKSGLNRQEYAVVRNRLVELVRYNFGYEVEIDLNMFSF